MAKQTFKTLVFKSTHDGQWHWDLNETPGRTVDLRFVRSTEGYDSAEEAREALETYFANTDFQGTLDVEVSASYQEWTIKNRGITVYWSQGGCQFFTGYVGFKFFSGDYTAQHPWPNMF